MALSTIDKRLAVMEHDLPSPDGIISKQDRAQLLDMSRINVDQTSLDPQGIGVQFANGAVRIGLGIGV